MKRGYPLGSIITTIIEPNQESPKLYDIDSKSHPQDRAKLNSVLQRLSFRQIAIHSASETRWVAIQFAIVINTDWARYTKALEVIKKLHKEQAQEIKTYRLKLEHLQTLKDSAYKLRESIAQDRERAESLRIKMQDLEREIQDVESKIHFTEIKQKDLLKLQEQITEKSATRSALFAEKESRHGSLQDEIEDSDEELEEWRVKFDEKVAQQESQISKLERELNDLKETEKILNERIIQYITEISKLQTEADANELLKSERDSAIQKLFAKHNLGPLPSGPFSDEMALNCTSRLNARMVDLEKDLLDKKGCIRVESSRACQARNSSHELGLWLGSWLGELGKIKLESARLRLEPRLCSSKARFVQGWFETEA
ncbi:hypothetical protein Cgig2_030483 [Carnegiea gigantea]|uniref:Uncharacterized protein n=1 Tax=Carnegiea gigantea TaxID=171969 RepID=A0A9Q1QM12_9CARY|nr:hypothetical protein Cgig2_030483 [Carnegiea gigantea]